MKKTIKSIGQKKITAIITVLIVLSSQFSFSQDPGGGPDGPPPAVPLDDYLLIILAAIGLVVAYFFIKSRNRKKAIH